MTWHWNILEELRANFLDPTGSSYWKTDVHLEQYDLTFGRKIFWKWQTVLGELDRLQWSPPDLPLYDWGCGSGVATEAFQAWKPRAEFYLHDRSKLAVNYSARKIRSGKLLAAAPENFILLVSHVINELDSRAFKELIGLCEKAAAVLWLEAGTKDHAQKLVEARDQLVLHFNPIAPCPDVLPCGMRKLDAERYWCHFFGEVPGEIHRDADWKKFSKALGIDLRSLPLSYLVLDKTQKRETGGGTRLVGQLRQHGGFDQMSAACPWPVRVKWTSTQDAAGV